MLRFAEIGLFLIPFALVVLWRVLAVRRPWLLWAAAASLVVFGGGTIFYGFDRSFSADARYVPASLENGEIVAGHARP